MIKIWKQHPPSLVSWMKILRVNRLRNGGRNGTFIVKMFDSIGLLPNTPRRLTLCSWYILFHTNVFIFKWKFIPDCIALTAAYISNMCCICLGNSRLNAMYHCCCLAWLAPQTVDEFLVLICQLFSLHEHSAYYISLLCVIGLMSLKPDNLLNVKNTQLYNGRKGLNYDGGYFFF